MGRGAPMIEALSTLGLQDFPEFCQSFCQMSESPTSSDIRVAMDRPISWY